MNENKKIIIYNNKAYALTENQFEKLSDVFRETENFPQDIPLGAPVHVQAFVHSNIGQYIFLGNVDRDIDAELSSLFRKSYNI